MFFWFRGVLVRLSSVRVLFILVLSFISLSAISEIYITVDSKGRKHYSDKKIEGADQQVVSLAGEKSDWSRFDIEIVDVDQVLTKEEITRIKSDVNVIYQFYDKTLFFDIYKVVPVKIRIFKNQQNYKEYLVNKYGSTSENSRGMYMRSTNEISVWLNPVRWQTFWTIKHEVSHAVVDTLTPYVPAWLNEGLAENMETIGYSNGKNFLSKHEENFSWAAKNNQNQNFLDVTKFLSLTSPKWRKTNSNAHAGEFVRMFLSNKLGIKYIVRLIHIFERGDRSLSHTHMDKIYVGGLAVLQNDWYRWVSRSAPERIYF